MIFLEPDEIRVLTGVAQKAKQIEQLRRMGIPFYVNASGHPVIARTAVEGGRKDHLDTIKPWRSSVLGA